MMKGIRRDKNALPSRPKKATLKEVVIKMVDLCPTDTLRGIRNRAILLLGFCGGYRRSELVAINIEDITFQPGKGMDIFHRFSKSDQEGKGNIKPIAQAKTELPYCPIRAVKKWIATAGITSGPLFRGITKDNVIKNTPMTSEVLYKLIKKCAVNLGYDFHDFSPHSLRSGFTTQALRNNARLDKIPSVTFHKNLRSLDSYIKHEDRYEDHPGENFF
jgi:integrase